MMTGVAKRRPEGGHLQAQEEHLRPGALKQRGAFLQYRGHRHHDEIEDRLDEPEAGDEADGKSQERPD